MMTKQLKSTGILVLILVILAGVTWWLLSTQQTAVSKKNIITLPEKEVVGLTLVKTDDQGEKTKIVLETAGANEWQIIEPIKDPAYLTTVENLLKAVTKIETEVATKETVNLADYGLAQPAISVQIDFKNQKPSKKFLVGMQTPVDYMFFAKFEDQPEILLVDSMVKNNLDQTLNAFREKQILTTSKEEIQTVKLWSVPDGVWYELERQNGVWNMTRPYQDQGSENMETILTSLTGLMINDYLDETPNLAQYGLAPKPAYQVELTLDKGRSVSVQAGGPVDEKWYVKTSQRQGIFQINNLSALEFLKLGLKDLVSQEVINYPEGEIESITVRMENGERKLSGKELDELKKQLGRASTVQPYSRKNKPVARAEFDNQKPLYRLTLKPKGKAGVELAIFTNPDKKENYVLTNSERPFVYELMDTEAERTLMEKIKNVK